MQDNLSISTTQPFNISDYPRTYTISEVWKISLFLLSILIGVPSITGLGYFGIVHQLTGLAATLVMVVCCLLFLLFSAFLALTVIRTKVVLMSDRIEYRDVFSTKTIQRTQIEGWRIMVFYGIKFLELSYANPTARKINFGLVFVPDQFFNNWFSDLPNAYQVALQKNQADICNDSLLGDSAEDRLNNAMRAKKRARIANVVMAILCGWAYFDPRPYIVFISLLLIMPWGTMAVIWISKGLYVFADKQNSARGDLSLPFFLPCLILALRALRDVTMMDGQQIIIPSIVLACMMTWVLYKCMKQQTRSAILFNGILCWVYMASAIVLSNAILDHGGGTTLPLQVLGKHSTSGKATMYYLSLPRWGSQTTASDTAVSLNLYQSVNIGSMVCVHRFEGALHMPWFVVTECPPSTM